MRPNNNDPAGRFMHAPSFKTLAASLLAATFLCGIAAADAPAPATLWKLAVSGNAEADSEIQFRVTPQSGEPILVSAKFSRGRGPIAIAKGLCEAFKAQLPKRVYRCEVMHGEEAQVKAGFEQPAFSLEVVESTLTGARVKISSE